MPTLNQKIPVLKPATGKWLAAGALLMLLAAGVAFFREPKEPASVDGAFASSRPNAHLAITTARPEDRLPTPAPAPGRSELDEFLDLLKESETHPLAAKFAEDFGKEPELRKLFQELKQGPPNAEAHDTLAAFARDVGARPAFTRLLTKFNQEPGFRQMIEPFMRLPQLRDAMREQLGALKSAKRSARAGATSRRAGASAPSSGGRPGTRTESPNASPGTSGGSALSASAGANERSEGSADTASTEERREKGDGHRVDTKLLLISGAGADKNAASAIASLCFRKDPAITQAQCDAIERHLGTYGLWEACLKANLFEMCGALCAQKPELNCGAPPDFYQTCLAANETDCAARCAAKPGCLPPGPSSPPATGAPGTGVGGRKKCEENCGVWGGPDGKTCCDPRSRALACVVLSGSACDPREVACKARGGDCYWLRSGSGKCCCPDGLQPGCPQ